MWEQNPVLTWALSTPPWVLAAQVEKHEQLGSELLPDFLRLHHIFSYIHTKLDKSANNSDITVLLGCLVHPWLPHEQMSELEASLGPIPRLCFSPLYQRDKVFFFLSSESLWMSKVSCIEAVGWRRSASSHCEMFAQWVLCTEVDIKLVPVGV